MWARLLHDVIEGTVIVATMSSSSDDSGSSGVLSLSSVEMMCQKFQNMEVIKKQLSPTDLSLKRVTHHVPLDTEPGGEEDDDDDSEGEERLLNRHWYACASYKNAHKQACNLFRCHGAWKLCYNANGKRVCMLL